MKIPPTIMLLLLLLPLISCGSSHSNQQAANASLSGNWLMTLSPQSSPQPLIYTGFLLQSADKVNGSFILAGGCSGVGPVSGTVKGQNLQLQVDEFGQALTLTGTVPSGAGGFVGGPFSTLSGGCSPAMSGTWSGQQITPLAGKFHGTLISAETNGTVTVSGSLTQGDNIGSSNASVAGTISTTGTPPFCSYLSSATITGTISGTALTLSFYSPNGSVVNDSGHSPLQATITADATSLTANYGFQGISQNCTGDLGTLQLSFP